MGKHWITKFYFRKTWENMQKHGKALDDKVLVQENTGTHRENTGNHRENKGKQSKTFGNIKWQSFILGKSREPLEKHGKTPGKNRKTRKNMQKQGKSLDDKVLFRENTGKHWENIGKTWENIGKTRNNIKKTQENNKNIGKY